MLLWVLFQRCDILPLILPVIDIHLDFLNFALTCVLNDLFTSLCRTNLVSTDLIWGYCVKLVKNTNRCKC